MYLYLVQHAEAKSKLEDPERGLTDRGIASIKKVSAFFKELKPDISTVWHSGKKRAEQTATILTAPLGLEEKTTVRSALGPNDDVSPAAEELEYTHQDNLLIVGHLPYLSRLASRLLTGNEAVGPINFKNAGIVCLERDLSGWKLAWMVTPEILPR